MLICPRCGAQNPVGVSLCARCSNLLSAPATATTLYPAYSGPMDKIIPTKNAPALLSYYLGLFSIFPLLGLPMGLVAFIQGIKGWRMANETPHVSGKAHAGIGIGCGTVGFLFNFAIIVFVIIVLVAEKTKH